MTRKLKKIQNQIEHKFRSVETKAYEAMEKILTAFNQGEAFQRESTTVLGTIIRYILAGRHKQIEKDSLEDPLGTLVIRGLDSEQL